VQNTLTTDPDKPISLEVILKPVQEKPQRKVKITGLDVRMVDETYEERDAEGNLVSPEDYLKKVREEVLAACHSMIELQTAWISKQRREELLTALEDRMVHIDILREILKRPDADSFDLLAHIAFGADLHSCEERANALFNLHKEFFESFSDEARSILLGLIEKYRYGGIEEADNPDVFRLSPFNSDVRRVAMPFGGIKELREAIDEMVTRLYFKEAA
jgi:type I restriction enzyme R subunit